MLRGNSLGQDQVNRTTIVMERDLRDKAKDLGINISEVSRIGVEAAIEAVEAKRAREAYRRLRNVQWNARSAKWS